MEDFKFIPNDIIYVEGTSVDASKSIDDIQVDFYRNICEQDKKRFVYLPEVMRYSMPNIEFDKQVLYDAVIKLSGMNITGRGFIVVEEDGTLSFLNLDSNTQAIDAQFMDDGFSQFGDIFEFSAPISKLESKIVCQLKELNFKIKENVVDENERYVSLFEDREEPSYRFARKSFVAPLELDDEIDELTAQVTMAIERLKKLGVDYTTILNIVKGEPKLSRMVIDDRYRIFLSDYQNMEIEMRPTSKALYLLYLKYTDGILFKDLPDYKDELMKIYAKVSNLSNGDAQREAVEALVNPLQNTINVTCSRVKEAFVCRFNNDLADYYVISGKRGEVKKIKLNRGLVDLRCTW